MRQIVLCFEGFKPQNVLILLLSMKHSYLLTATWVYRIFQYSLEEHKVIYLPSRHLHVQN